MNIFQLVLNIRSCIFFLTIALLGSCDEQSCVDEDLNKMNRSEIMDIFLNRTFPSIDNTTFLNENCETISKDSLMFLFGTDGDYISDFYTNDNNEIQVVVFRKSTSEDREFIKALRDSVKVLRKFEKEGQRKVELIDIDCSKAGYVLTHAYERDQENRRGSSIDQSIDKANLSIIISILEKCDKSTFTENDFNAIWLVLQHSNLYQMKKYFNDLKEGVNRGLLAASKLALMEDRILVSEDKPQKYGSQVYKDSNGNWQVYPIEDAENVDHRRADVGLGPLSEYLVRWKINYH